MHVSSKSDSVSRFKLMKSVYNDKMLENIRLRRRVEEAKQKLEIIEAAKITEVCNKVSEFRYD